MSGTTHRFALIDYGAGNITSVAKGFAAAGAELVTAASPADLDRFSGIVIPGVGHFGAASSLSAAWRQAIARRVTAGVPLLGICLGMQLLFEGSDEAADVPGLALLAGRCTLMTAARPLKIPHVGWNALQPVRRTPLLDDVPAGAQVYFTHSFAAPVTPDTAATAQHGGAFAAVVQREHIGGVQFHPEKSGDLGIRILRNFVRMTRG